MKPVRTAQGWISRLGLLGGIAVHALQRNTLRATLTALGIIIGVASVVAMVALGNGASDSIQSKVAALGQNLLMVFAGSRHTAGVNSGSGSASTLTVPDALSIGREIQAVAAVSPEVTIAAQALANGRNWSTSVVGESADYLSIRDWKLAAGSMFCDRDVRAAAAVAVIGSKTSAELFGPLNPVGQSVRVQKIPFVIIGLLESKGSGMGGQNQDDRLIIPYTTAMKRISGDRYLRSINVQVADARHMDAVQSQITSLLRQRHRLIDSDGSDFNIFSQQEIAETVSSVTQIVTLLLGAVAGISLLVGGIGIMNIMLVSVTERTREVGIRMAIGAQPGDIRMQFLLESVLLSLLGGTIGIVLGVAAAKLVGHVSNFEARVSTNSVLLAFTVSSAIGVFFGLYPAHKAARLNPIEALRYE